MPIADVARPYTPAPSLLVAVPMMPCAPEASEVLVTDKMCGALEPLNVSGTGTPVRNALESKPSSVSALRFVTFAALFTENGAPTTLENNGGAEKVLTAENVGRY